MKKQFLALGLTMMSVLTLSSCNKKNNEPQMPEIKGLELTLTDNNGIGDGSTAYEIKGGDFFLKKGVYNLKGWVYITKGASLTIAPGTIIKGDKATKATLIVEPGGKLMAKGSALEPIVFTSAAPAGQRKPGDWGGIVICGNAVNNQDWATIEGGLRTQFGGNDNQDNSGVLSYVRIEFGGAPFKQDSEINGLTLASVGSGTQIDHVQVSYSNDDSFEWFGGAVNASHLIAYKGWDDDFDTDFGYSGKVQFALSVRDSRIADKSYSNGFESDNDGSGSQKTPITSCVFSNVTLIGPMALDKSFRNTGDYVNGGNMMPNNGSNLGQFQSGAQIRRNSNLSLFNSVIAGWPVGLIVENDKGSATQTAAAKGSLCVMNNVMAGVAVTATDANKKLVAGWSDNGGNVFDTARKPFSWDFFEKQDNANSILPNYDDLKLGTDFMPQAGSLLLTSARFTDIKLKGMKVVNYRGAFAQGDDWTKGWTNFDPQDTKY